MKTVSISIIMFDIPLIWILKQTKTIIKLYKLKRKKEMPINRYIGSGALSGKMLLVRIIENNKIDAYFRSGQVK